MSLVKKIKTSFSVPTEILALECFKTDLGQNFYLSHLRMDKEKVDLIATKFETNISKLLEGYDKALPIFLLIGGRKILSNSVTAQNENDIVRLAFPNVPKEDILYETENLDNTSFHVSLARKEVVLEIVQMIQDKGFRPVELNIGLGSLHKLLKKQFEKQSIELTNYHIDVDGFVVTNREVETKKTQDIFGQQISEEFIVSYLTGLNFFLRKSYRSKFDKIEFWRKDWFFENLIRKAGKIVIALFLVFLMASFFVWNTYHDANQSQTYSNATYEASFDLLKKLEVSFQEKQEFLEMNKSSHLNYSKMADQIAKEIPRGIFLNSIDISPFVKRDKRTNLVRFKKEEIKIEGETKNYKIFNSWFSNIKELDWVSEIEVLGYQEQNKGHKAEFSINILVK